MSGFNLNKLDYITDGFDAKYFIETGTYLGETTMTACQRFPHVFSIEASIPLFMKAALHLNSIRKPHFLLGDSGVLLPQLIRGINDKIVFYLDAHWFKFTDEPVSNEYGFPLWEELKAIYKFQHHPCIIIVDDVHAFGKAKYGWQGVTEETVLSRIDRITDHYISDDQFVMVRE